MSDKTFQFASRSRRVGFVQIDNPVIASAKLSATAKVTYGLMLMYAGQDESCYPGQERLAGQVPCSERSLRDATRELEEAGLVKVVRRGQGKTNIYYVGDVDHLFRPADSAGLDRQQLPLGSAAVADQDRQQVPGNKTEGNKTQEKQTQSKAAAPPRTSSDGRSCPATVDRKPTTTAECDMAWAVMDAFNAAAGTKVSAKGFVEKIIRRMREHPELSVEDHAAVVRGVLGGRRWWSGRPDPAIIYGSDEQFDRSLNQHPPGNAAVHTPGGPVASGVHTDDEHAERMARYAGRVKYDDD